MKYCVKIGSDFEINSAEVIDPNLVEAASKAVKVSSDNRTRKLIIVMASLTGAAAIAICALIGFKDGTYNEVSSVWNVVGPIFAGIVTYFFSN